LQENSGLTLGFNSTALAQLLGDLSQHIHSDAFAQAARLAQYPSAFTRSRQLPLPHLVGALVSRHSSSQQVMRDGFFASLGTDDGTGLGHVRGVSDRAFAKARNHLDWNALPELNARLLAAARAFVPRCHGQRVVAADASLFMPALRAGHQARLVKVDQRLFARSLPSAELCLNARVYGAQVRERQMLFESLEQPGLRICWYWTGATPPAGWSRIWRSRVSAFAFAATRPMAGWRCRSSCKASTMSPSCN